MDNHTLDQVLRNLYNTAVSSIIEANIRLEREYFAENKDRIPYGEIMDGCSFEDHYKGMKFTVMEDEPQVERVFMFLQEYFLFSYGHDLMFKKKLEADIFTTDPMEKFIYPKLEAAAKEKYNDLSVARENPDVEENIKGIARMVQVYIDLSSLLYLLYCCDFKFSKGWEGICPDTYEEVLEILKKSGIKVGDFLHALADYKCDIMSDILGEIQNPQLRDQYLRKVEELRKEKHEDLKTHASAHLPVTYFLEHTFLDFVKGDHRPSILDGDTPDDGAKTIQIQI